MEILSDQIQHMREDIVTLRVGGSQCCAKLRVDHALELETLKFGSVLYETCCTKLQADNHVCKLTIAGDIAAWL